MIILVSPENYRVLEDPAVQRCLISAARIPEGTRIHVVPDLPSEDGDGAPILAFRVSAGELHYWRGEPIQLPDAIKHKLGLR